jgi:hypothetical protein
MPDGVIQYQGAYAHHPEFQTRVVVHNALFRIGQGSVDD